jgi:hypothetical protein
MDALIVVADRLLRDGYITDRQRALLQTYRGTVVNDSQFPVDVTESGDVYVHGGAYPLILKGYAREG